MTPRPRTVRARRSRRLALVAGTALVVAVPSVAGAATDDTATPTTAAGGKEAATPSTAADGSTPTDSPAPAGAAIEPLAVVDIGATGPGIEVGSVIEGPTAVANLALANMPVADGATVAEYAASYSADLSDAAAPSYTGNLTIISTAQSEMPAADILAAYQTAIETLGAFEATTATASSEGVTSDQLELDPVTDSAAVETTAAGSVPTEAAAPLGSYDIVVSRSEDAPGIVAVEVTQSIPTIEGPAPAVPEAVADNFTVPLGVAEANGWTVAGWSYRDGFNQFLGGAPFRSADMDFAAGPGTPEDLPALGDLLIAEFGATTYESVETDSISYTFEDESSWYLSYRDFWVGNEMSLSWSLTLD